MMPLDGRTLFFIAASLVPSVLAFGVLLLIARVRRSSLSIVPGAIAAAALAPVLATYFGVRIVIQSLQALATTMGGLAAISAGLYEAMQPIVFASYLACGLLAIGVIVAMRAVIDDEQPISTVATMAALLLALAALALTPFALRGVTGTIVDILDPHIPHASGIAETSQGLATRLMTIAAGALIMAAALLGSIAAIGIVRPKQQQGSALGRVVVFVALLALGMAIVNVVVSRSWSATLYHTAVTGELVR